MKLTWGTADGAAGYTVYRRGDELDEWTYLATTSSTAYVDTSAQRGMPYYYKVEPDGTDGTYFAVSSDLTYRVKSVVVKSLTNPKSRAVKLKWKKSVIATGYEIQYTKKTSFSGASKIDIPSRTTNKKTITSLTKGATYRLRIRGYYTVDGVKYYSAWTGAWTIENIN